MTGKELRIVYMGTPDFAVESLRKLVENGYNVVAVVTMPDKPAGRGLKLKGSAVKEYAVSVGLPILQPVKLSAPEFVEELSSYQPDLGIVVAFKMLPTVIWSMPKYGTFNLHASLLPDYRGAAPINWAIINGDKITGNTTFMLDRQIDTGDVLLRESVEITDSDCAGTLHDKLMYMGGDLVVKSVDVIASGEGKTQSQSEINDSAMRPAPKIFKEDCKLDFSCDLETIHNKVRGLSPYPAAWCELNGINFKVFATQMERSELSVSGEIISDGKSLKIGCQRGYLIIDELQMAGKKRMKTSDFLRGYKF